MPPLRAAPFTIIRDPNTASASSRSQGATISGRQLGRVLTVAVEQHDDVEVVLDRQRYPAFWLPPYPRFAGGGSL